MSDIMYFYLMLLLNLTGFNQCPVSPEIGKFDLNKRGQNEEHRIHQKFPIITRELG